MNFRQHAANAAAAKFLNRRDRCTDQWPAKATERETLLWLEHIECAGRQHDQRRAAIRETERAGVLGALRSTGHEIIDLTYGQLEGFAGNMLELRNDRGAPLIVLSASALDVLEPQQRAALSRLGK